MTDNNHMTITLISPKAQWATLERLVRILKVDFPHATVHGHREFAAKACPSFDVQEWLKNKGI